MRACCTDTENQRLDVNTETMRVVSCRACGVRVIEWRVQPGRLGLESLNMQVVGTDGGQP